MAESILARDFDWVTAERECTFDHPTVVSLFREELKKAVNAANIPDPQFRFEELLATKTFWIVRRLDHVNVKVVTFAMDGREMLVSLYSAEYSPGVSAPLGLYNDSKINDIFRVKLILNDDGECRFQINDKGEYPRWQVVRKALKPLFSPDLV